VQARGEIARPVVVVELPFQFAARRKRSRFLERDSRVRRCSLVPVERGKEWL
jgi:hypothetical protein